MAVDQGRDDAPIFGPGIVSCEEGIFSVQSDRSDGSFNGVVVHLDATVGQEQV